MASGDGGELGGIGTESPVVPVKRNHGVVSSSSSGDIESEESNDELQTAIKVKLSGWLSETAKAQAEISRSHVRAVGLEITKLHAWVQCGCTRDSNKQRKEEDYYNGEAHVETLLLALEKGNVNFSDMLRELNQLQAWVLWKFRGQVEDADENRKKDDWYDAKRFIGYLLADTLLAACSANRLGQDCFAFLREEYLPYLVSISLEEFLRIRAYFIWEENDRKEDADKPRQDIHYFEAMNWAYDSMVNCRNREPQAFARQHSLDVVRAYVDKNRGKLAQIAQAKAYTHQRLRLGGCTKEDIDDYVSQLYPTISNGLLGDLPCLKVADDLLIRIYCDPHTVNLLEYVFKCFLCSAVGHPRHEEIRSIAQKKPLAAVFASKGG